MPGQFTIDPFTQVHQAIWNALTAYQPWAQFVPPGARINAVPLGPLSAKAKATMPGDVPEVRILQAGWSWNEGNAKTINIHQHFAVEMNTTAQNVIPLNTLKFLSLIALVQEKAKQVNFGLSFVIDWSAQGVAREVPMESDSGLKMWRSAVFVTVNMLLAYSDIMAM